MDNSLVQARIISNKSTQQYTAQQETQIIKIEQTNETQHKQTDRQKEY